MGAWNSDSHARALKRIADLRARLNPNSGSTPNEMATASKLIEKEARKIPSVERIPKEPLPDMPKASFHPKGSVHRINHKFVLHMGKQAQVLNYNPSQDRYHVLVIKNGKGIGTTHLKADQLDPI